MLLEIIRWLDRCISQTTTFRVLGRARSESRNSHRYFVVMYKIYIVLQGCRAYAIKDMFQVCTGAVDCVALWTRTSSKVWTCFKNDPKIRKTKHFFHRFGHVSHLWQRQKHCSQWDECSVWVLGRACCRNHMKRCLLCAKTSVYYGEYMVKNARDQGPGRNNQGLFQLLISIWQPTRSMKSEERLPQQRVLSNTLPINQELEPENSAISRSCSSCQTFST